MFTTCTTGYGIYSAYEPVLTLLDMVYIDKPCDAGGDASIDEPIQRMLSDGTVAFQIDAARLTLTRSSDGLQAVTD